MNPSSSNDRPAGAPGLDFIETVSAALTDLIELVQSLPVPADQAERTAKILDRLGEELAGAAAMVRALPGQPREAPATRSRPWRRSSPQRRQNTTSAAGWRT